MSKPCEYCGVDLPLGVDKGTRRVRSFHFASCEKRPHSPNIEAQRDALLEALKQCRNAIQGGQTIEPYDSRGAGYQQCFGIAFLDQLNAAIKAAEEGK